MYMYVYIYISFTQYIEVLIVRLHQSHSPQRYNTEATKTSKDIFQFTPAAYSKTLDLLLGRRWLWKVACQLEAQDM